MVRTWCRHTHNHIDDQIDVLDPWDPRGFLYFRVRRRPNVRVDPVFKERSSAIQLVGPQFCQ